MASINLSKKQKSKCDDSDTEWRPSIESDDSDNHPTKKQKMENVGFQRVWSKEEEIAILEAYLNYPSRPSTDYDSFLNFVKGRLQEKTTKTQLQHKLTRLRKKYKRNVEKRSFLKPHEEKLFKLSKRIWGEQVKAKAKAKVEGSDLVLREGSAADLEDWFRRNPGQLISDKDREEMLEKLQSVKIGKARQYLSEIQVMEEQAKLAIHALQATLT